LFLHSNCVLKPMQYKDISLNPSLDYQNKIKM